MSNERKPVIIVSGAPRCGTTLVMRMLQAGGVPLYYETSTHVENGLTQRGLVKRRTFRKLRGKALKLLELGVRSKLPAAFPGLKVIYCVRDLDAQARSILKYAAIQDIDVGGEEHVAQVREHVERVVQHGLWHCERIGADTFVLGYEHVLAEPREQAQALAEWLGMELDVDAMAALVDTGRDGSTAKDMFAREVEMAKAAGDEVTGAARAFGVRDKAL